MSNNAPGPWGPPPGQPGPGQWGQQQPGPPGPFGSGPYGGPPPQPPRQQGNPGLGILLGVVAMVVAAVVYAYILKESEHQIGYMAIAVGALIAVALGKVGGRNPVLPVIGVVLSVLGVFIGQYLGVAMWVQDANDMSLSEVLTDSRMFDSWKEFLEPMDALFYLLAGFEGFVITKRVAG
ncbi:hypothetical protein [Embleya scabrispora]|uniref:hypothetical protein n=1 Tax=Embleya scabrispora TaxID=159449 RepID=UPI001319D647|nr:hypothetical protein [Embleya scabrispora]MYS81734.1 hypothetical protein [Streptomyces sp. SID5474]